MVPAFHIPPSKPPNAGEGGFTSPLLFAPLEAAATYHNTHTHIYACLSGRRLFPASLQSPVAEAELAVHEAVAVNGHRPCVLQGL